MRVEVLIAHGPWCIGDIIPDMPPGAAGEKIIRGLLREAPDEEVKSMRSPIDRMMRKSVKK